MQKTVSILTALFLIASLLCGSAFACDGCDESGYLGTMTVVNCRE